MRIPGGILIPDVPPSGGGCLGIIILIVIIGAMVANKIDTGNFISGYTTSNKVGSPAYYRELEQKKAIEREIIERPEKERLAKIKAKKDKDERTFHLIVGKAIPTIHIPPGVSFQVESNNPFAVTDDNGRITLKVDKGWNMLNSDPSVSFCLKLMGLEKGTIIDIGGYHFQADTFPIHRCEVSIPNFFTVRR